MIVTKGAVNVSVYLRIVDSTDGTPETGVVFDSAGIDLWYFRPGAVHQSITEVTTTEGAAHTDGGFIHISDGNYKLDVPDAAFASGVDYVLFGGTVTGMVVFGPTVTLTDVDLMDAVRGGMTALPNAAANAAGGLATSAGGATGIDDLATSTALTTAQNDLDTITGTAGVIIDDSAANDTTMSDAIWDEDATGHQTLGTFGQAIGDPGADATTIYQSVATDAAGDNIAIDIVAVKAETALIVADTNELQTDDVPGLIAALNDIAAGDVWAVDATTQQAQGTFGQAIGDPVADTTTIYQSVATDAAGDNVAIDIIAVKAETALIVADTNELQTDDVPGLIATAQADLDTITDADGVILGAAGVDLIWDEDIVAAHNTADTAGAILNNILPEKNAAFSDIEFLFVAASDHVTPVTGATGTAVTRSIDGGAFGAGTGTLAEVANGIYQYDASAADMNGTIITFRFVGTGGTPGAPDDAFVTIKTSG